MQWAIVIAAFLASAVEFVEAFTLVLVARITTNWRSAIVGALAAVATLAVIVGTLERCTKGLICGTLAA